MAAAVLAVAGAVAFAPAASAHTVLTASDPTAGASLESGPTRVTATFNEEVQPTFAALTVVGPDGNLWSTGEARVDSRNVSVGLRPLGPPGSYTVNYRVTSDDGHVVSGSWQFTVTAAGAGTPGPALQSATQSKPLPRWPFIVAIVVILAGVGGWGLRRRS